MMKQSFKKELQNLTDSSRKALILELDIQINHYSSDLKNFFKKAAKEGNGGVPVDDVIQFFIELTGIQLIHYSSFVSKLQKLTGLKVNSQGIIQWEK